MTAETLLSTTLIQLQFNLQLFYVNAMKIYHHSTAKGSSSQEINQRQRNFSLNSLATRVNSAFRLQVGYFFEAEESK